MNLELSAPEDRARTFTVPRSEKPVILVVRSDVGILAASVNGTESGQVSTWADFSASTTGW